MGWWMTKSMAMVPKTGVRLRQGVAPLELPGTAVRVREPGAHPVARRLPPRVKQCVRVQMHADEMPCAILAAGDRQDMLPGPQRPENRTFNTLAHSVTHSVVIRPRRHLQATM